MATTILLILAAYAGLGLSIGLVFLLFGAVRIDPGVRGAPLLFRLILLPGAAALWPVVLIKWLRCSAKEG